MWRKKFNDIRKKSGISLDELSERSGVPKSTLAKITSGVTKSPPIDTMRKLVHAMGHTLDDLDDTCRPDQLTSDEKRIALAYRQATDKEKEVIETVLKDYLKPEQEKTATAG